MSALEYLTEEPPNAGIPTKWMTGRLLGQAEMYQRNNFSIPEPPDSFEVVFPGRVPTRVTPSDLERLPQVERVVLLECAGNGRTYMQPIPEGTPWGLGAVSPIVVTGVPLARVIAPVPATVEELVFTGADIGVVEPEGAINYQFSLRAERLDELEPLLVTRIGGEPITAVHGGPVRLIVPRMYAMASVKWLVRIEAIRSSFNGHFVSKYRFFGDDRAPEASRVERIDVRSLIASPSNGETVITNRLTVQGSAWSGNGDILSVDLFVDGRRHEAELTSVGHGVVSWETTVVLANGRHHLHVRATDTAGNIQPEQPRWNTNGYANNVVHRLEVDVATDGSS